MEKNLEMSKKVRVKGSGLLLISSVLSEFFFHDTWVTGKSCMSHAKTFYDFFVRNKMNRVTLQDCMVFYEIFND